MGRVSDLRQELGYDTAEVECKTRQMFCISLQGTLGAFVSATSVSMDFNNIKCWNCGGMGHVRVKCPSHIIPGRDKAPIEDGRPNFEVRVNGKRLVVFLDTGSQATLIKAEAFRTISQVRLKLCNKRLTAVNGQTIEIVGQCTLNFEVEKDKIQPHGCTGVDNLSFPGDILMGMDIPMDGYGEELHIACQQ